MEFVSCDGAIEVHVDVIYIQVTIINMGFAYPAQYPEVNY